MNVLSTATRAWRSCASAASPAMSTSLRSGFVGDSSQTSRVLGSKAASTFSRQGGAGGVAGAGVLVALVDADGLLGEGGGLVDRDDHGAGGRVGWLPGMNCP